MCQCANSHDFGPHYDCSIFQIEAIFRYSWVIKINKFVALMIRLYVRNAFIQWNHNAGKLKPTEKVDLSLPYKIHAVSAYII